MAHPTVDIPVVTNLPGLAHSRDLVRFRQHVRACEPCAVVHGEDGECFEYCPKGHHLVHLIEAQVEMMEAASFYN